MKRAGLLKRRLTVIPDEVKAEVRARSRGRCEIEHPDCSGYAAHYHHRQLRSQGGPHTAENLIHLCATMHRRIHGHPEASYRLGWLVRQGADPLTTPWTSRDNQPLR